MSCSGTIEITRGDDESIVVTFTDVNDDPIDLTGSTVFFTVKTAERLNGQNDDDASIKKNVTDHTDPTNGITTIPLTSVDTNLDPTANYWYDLQLKDSSGNISSTRKGKFSILADVTRRTTT
jgi:hypothetical protein